MAALARPSGSVAAIALTPGRIVERFCAVIVPCIILVLSSSRRRLLVVSAAAHACASVRLMDVPFGMTGELTLMRP